MTCIPEMYKWGGTFMKTKYLKRYVFFAVWIEQLGNKCNIRFIADMPIIGADLLGK